MIRSFKMCPFKVLGVALLFLRVFPEAPAMAAEQDKTNSPLSAIRSSLSRVCTLYVATNISSFDRSVPAQFAVITNAETVTNFVGAVERSDIVAKSWRSWCCDPVPVVLCTAQHEPVAALMCYFETARGVSFTINSVKMYPPPSTNELFEIGEPFYTGSQFAIIDEWRGAGVLLDRRQPSTVKDRDLLESLNKSR